MLPVIAASTVFFPSEAALEKALAPLGPACVKERMSAAKTSNKVEFQIDASYDAKKTAPERNPGCGILLKSQIFHNKHLSVFCPLTPRAPHHLAIAFNRPIRGMSEVSEEENQELFKTIRRIAEIYKEVSIQGFVIAQYEKPQLGHQERCVVEIIPQLPGFQNVKNIPDKVACNWHVLFRGADLTPIETPRYESEVVFWQQAFAKEPSPLAESATKITFPHTRSESHQKEAECFLFRHFLEILEDHGGHCSTPVPTLPEMPTLVAEDVHEVTVKECLFCNSEVQERQRIFEYQGVTLFYNMRQVEGGECFLILPNRHVNKVYDLNESEISALWTLRGALVSVLLTLYPEYEVIDYIQDDPSVGQTVFHSHEQLVAVNPDTIALEWTLLSLYGGANISPQKMQERRTFFNEKLTKILD